MVGTIETNRLENWGEGHTQRGRRANRSVFVPLHVGVRTTDTHKRMKRAAITPHHPTKETLPPDTWLGNVPICIAPPSGPSAGRRQSKKTEKNVAPRGRDTQ